MRAVNRQCAGLLDDYSETAQEKLQQFDVRVKRYLAWRQRTNRFAHYNSRPEWGTTIHPSQFKRSPSAKALWPAIVVLLPGAQDAGVKIKVCGVWPSGCDVLGGNPASRNIASNSLKV